jgi:hypothetical protein
MLLRRRLPVDQAACSAQKASALLDRAAVELGVAHGRLLVSATIVAA